MLGREGHCSVSEITALASAGVGLQLAPGFACTDDATGHCSPESTAAFASREAVEFGFMEAEDFLIVMKWESLNQTIVSQSQLLRPSDEKDCFFQPHTIPAILRRPTSL